MLRKLVTTVVLLGFILLSRSPKIPASNPNLEYKLYLPVSINLYPLVNVVKLGVVDWIGYPGYLCIYGYTSSIMSSAVYSVTLSVDVTNYPYCDPISDICPPPYSETHYLEPMLDATLPNQKNPFSYCLSYGKGGYRYGAVELTAASLIPPNGRVIYPLTVTSLIKEGSGWDTVVHGTVKNESGHHLTEVRVVGIPGLCSAREADLGNTMLDPGEDTSYIFYNFYCGWANPGGPLPAMLEISAQGVAEP